MTNLYGRAARAGAPEAWARPWRGFFRAAVVAAAVTMLSSCSVERYYLKPERKSELPLDWAAIVEAANNAASPKGSCVLQTGPRKDDASAGKDKHPDWLDYHVLVVDSAGVGAGAVADESAEGDEKTYWRHFQRLMAGFEASGKTHLLVYFNGGLNSKDLVLKQAAEQVPCIMHETDYYPIFMIWSTAALETYFEQISKTRGGQIRENPQPAPLSLIGDVGQGMARAPVVYWDNAIRYAESTVLVDEKDEKSEFRVELIPGDPCSKDANDQMERDRLGCFRHVHPLSKETSWGTDLDVANTSMYVLASPLRILSTPFVDAIGKTAWENMLRRSRTTVRTVWEVQPEFVRAGEREQAAQEKRCYPHGTGGFSKFFQDFDRYLGASPDAPDGSCRLVRRREGAPVGLTAIGHSMGTIVLNELIPKYSNLPYRNIVYMGAATSIRDFDRSMSSVIRILHAKNHKVDAKNHKVARGPDVHFYNLMLHPLVEAREISVRGTTPAGSLLEWIDGMYEGPETVADRTLGKWRNVRRTSHFFRGELGKHMTFRVFNRVRGAKGEISACEAAEFGAKDISTGSPKDWRINPRAHGAFNDTGLCFWHPAFWGEEPKNYKERLRDGAADAKRK